MQRFLCWTLASIPFFVSRADAAEIVAPGFGIDARHAFPATDLHATLADTNRVTFDGLNVALETDAGFPIATLASLSQSVFGSFLLVDPTQTYVILGENSNGNMYVVPLAGGGATFLADLDNNYDAAFEDATHILVSAATCGFGCGNDLVRVDVTNGAITPLAHVAGPSGPLDVSATGDLYYCTQDGSTFPPPPASSKIIRFTNAQIHAGMLLGDADATTFVNALEGGSSMRFERVFGHLFLCEAPFGGTNKLLEFDAAGTRVDEVIVTSNTLSALEFAYAGGTASFQAFQPANVTLRFSSTDYSVFTSEIVTLRPKRPVATTSGPGLTGVGNVTFQVTGAYPNSSYLILAGPVGSYNPSESTFNLFTYLFHTGIPFDQIRRTGIFVPTDASGNGSFTYFNPGTLQGTRVLQALVKNAQGAFVGSSNAAFN